jgi:hypothetical protein
LFANIFALGEHAALSEVDFPHFDVPPIQTSSALDN